MLIANSKNTISNWVEQNLELGKGFDSSTLFVLPNGAKRSPDASWVEKGGWDALSRAQQDGYPPLYPDFACLIHNLGVDVGAEGVEAAQLAAETRC